MKKFPVTAALQPYIKFFYVLEDPLGDWLDNHPQGSLDLLFTIQNHLFFKPQATQEVILDRIFIVAQQEGPFQVGFAPYSKFIGINFNPEGFYKVLQLPLAEMSNFACDVTDMLPWTFRELHEKLYESQTGTRWLPILENFLLWQLHQANASLNPFDRMVQHIRSCKGGITVEKLADQLFVSRRTLHRQFRERIGIAPKSYINIVRFQNSLSQFYQAPYKGWANVYYDFGYYDQTHFIRDFKRFTGRTPSSFLQSERSLSDFFLQGRTNEGQLFFD